MLCIGLKHFKKVVDRFVLVLNGTRFNAPTASAFAEQKTVPYGVVWIGAYDVGLTSGNEGVQLKNAWSGASYDLPMPSHNTSH